MNRREFLTFAAASLAAARRGLAQADSLRFVALGQALILRRLPDTADHRRLVAHLAGADVCFTDLEGAIRGASAVDARALPQGVVAEPAVLDSLRQLSINLMSLANNHSNDLGAAGMLSTIEETRRRGFSFAGTGRDLVEAARPGYLESRKGTVALVAMASDNVAANAMAAEGRTGVNHVAQRGGVVDAADAERVLTAITAASTRAKWVFVYQHDHYWEPNWQDTPEWKKAWCRRCIDAGATAFISHGAPLLHGIEIYKHRPIFYGLGNFIFQLATIFPAGVPARYTQREVWQSVIADCEFRDGEISALRLNPITLHGSGDPRLVEGAEAAEILQRLQMLSKPYGTVFEIQGSRATIGLK